MNLEIFVILAPKNSFFFFFFFFLEILGIFLGGFSSLPVSFTIFLYKVLFFYNFIFVFLEKNRFEQRKYIFFYFLPFTSLFRHFPSFSTIFLFSNLFRRFPTYYAIVLLNPPFFSLPPFPPFFNLFRRFPTYFAILILNPPSSHFPLFPVFFLPFSDVFFLFSFFMKIPIFHFYSFFLNSFLLKIRPPDNFTYFFGLIFS